MIPRKLSLAAAFIGLLLAFYYASEGDAFWAAFMLASSFASFAAVVLQGPQDD